jgi:hypothetical protein
MVVFEPESCITLVKPGRVHPNPIQDSLITATVDNNSRGADVKICPGVKLKLTRSDWSTTALLGSRTGSSRTHNEQHMRPALSPSIPLQIYCTACVSSQSPCILPLSSNSVNMRSLALRSIGLQRQVSVSPVAISRCWLLFKANSPLFCPKMLNEANLSFSLAAFAVCTVAGSAVFLYEARQPNHHQPTVASN